MLPFDVRADGQETPLKSMDNWNGYPAQRGRILEAASDANARLIAAAPELLATLKMLVTEVQSIDRAPGSLTPHMADAMNWAYSAIAKAEG